MSNCRIHHLPHRHSLILKDTRFQANQSVQKSYSKQEKSLSLSWFNILPTHSSNDPKLYATVIGQAISDLAHPLIITIGVLCRFHLHTTSITERIHIYKPANRINLSRNNSVHSLPQDDSNIRGYPERANFLSMCSFPCLGTRRDLTPIRIIVARYSKVDIILHESLKKDVTSIGRIKWNSSHPVHIHLIKRNLQFLKIPPKTIMNHQITHPQLGLPLHHLRPHQCLIFPIKQSQIPQHINRFSIPNHTNTLFCNFVKFCWYLW